MENNETNKEKKGNAYNGWISLVVNLLFYASIVFYLVLIKEMGWGDMPIHAFGLAGILILSIFVSRGFFTLQPNEAAVLILFGAYEGTWRKSGFSWANPLLKKVKVSLRARNLDGGKLKVNDKRGNPVEIGVVVVWKVEDTAQASFDVDNFEQFVAVQSESAVRHLARSYAYDSADTESPDDEGIQTLRGGSDEILLALKEELQKRVYKAGVRVEEARITHLAYAPEIAQAMLRRQQAEAVISARKKIVQGAVSIVDMALKGLSEQHVVELDEERKAAMVSNLLVVLCGESEVHPVINTGTLYN